MNENTVGATIVLPFKPRDFVYMIIRDINAIAQCEILSVNVKWDAISNKTNIVYKISPSYSDSFTICSDKAKEIMFPNIEEAKRAMGNSNPKPKYIGWWNVGGNNHRVSDMRDYDLRGIS